MEAAEPEQTPWYASIVTRITSVFGALLIGTVAMLGWVSWRATRTELITQAHRAMDHSLDIAITRMQTMDRTLRENLDLLASNQAVMAWCAAIGANDPEAEREARELVATFLEPVIRSRTRFSQVRLIGADSAGREVVRFDRSGRDVYRVPDALLQPKGERDYYRLGMAAPDGARLSFPIDLNREYGRLEQPFVPTLRVAAPLFTPQGTRAGMIVINNDMRVLFSELLAMADSGRALILARQDGEVVLHPDTAMMFRFELGSSNRIERMLPRADEAGEADPLLVGYRRFVLGPSENTYTLAITQPMSGLLGTLREKRNGVVALSAAFALGATALMALFALGLRGRLNRLTGLMERYAIGSAEELPIDRRDEFGRLTRGLRTMQERIDARVKELETARAAAEASDRQRQDLLANMSHEVRTPLNAIIGMSSEVDRASLSAADRERMAIVERSAERLKGLVDDLLMHARIGEGKLALRPSAVDVRALVGDVISAHLPQASAKGLRVESVIGTLPPALLTDGLRLHQIIDNLVGNAVRFTQQGSVTITVEMTAPDQLGISVRDTGPGIPPDQRERIFQRFERATASEQEHGAGLGLAITKRVVDLLGGTLDLRSEVGTGSSFTVVLPVAPAEAEWPAVHPEADTRGVKVLYVEDVATNRMLVQEWAARWGWDLTLATTGEGAMGICGQARFDLLLIDLGLGPGMSGIELVRRLRRDGHHRYTPMIALTAQASDDEDTAILGAGLNDRVTKPVDRAELSAIVAYWSDRTEAAEEPDLRRLSAQYDHDTAKLHAVYELYRKEFTERRLALRTALRTRDADLLRDTRHALRPHWQLLGLLNGVDSLDRLSVDGAEDAVEVVVSAFRSCDRAWMRALRSGSPSTVVVAGS